MTNNSEPKTSFASIPRTLQECDQWVLYKLVWNQKRGKNDKIPYQTNGLKASTNLLHLWTNFETAKIHLELLEDFSGLGFVFTKEDPFCGIDLDSCVNPITNEIESWALELIAQFEGAYVEFSPSRTGVHIITRAKLPGNGKRKGQIEIYDQGRYFTVTGNVYQSSPAKLSNQQAQLDDLLKTTFGALPNDLHNADFESPLQGNKLSDKEINQIIENASNAANGKKFKELFHGKTDAFENDDSRADMSLCTTLAFWTDCNEIAMNQIFRMSGLYRTDKWEREDYRIRTIRNAIAYYEKSKIKGKFDEIKLASDSQDNPNGLPIIHIADIEKKSITYLIDQLWTESSVGFISAQPGTFKTWLVWEFGFSVSTGTKALGHFQTKKGKVLAFNAEDDPSTNTVQRLEGIAKSKGISLKDADFHLIKVHSLHLDDPKTQGLLEKTISFHKPALVILDPFVALHMKDENSASEISPILDYLRRLNRQYKCSIMLVCHDRKSPGRGGREAQTRGTSAIHGWRDTVIYLDKKNGLVKATFQHRGAPPVNPLTFSVTIVSTGTDIEFAEIRKAGEAEVMEATISDFKDEIIINLKAQGPMTRNEIIKKTGKNRGKVLETIRSMLSLNIAEEIPALPETSAKRIQFLEPTGTGTEQLSSSSTPFRGEL